jgi:hypothetical protein
MKKSSIVASVGALTAVALLVLSAAALADHVSVQDAKNDATGGAVDIKEASHGHTPKGKLRHVIEAYQSFSANEPFLRITTPGGKKYEVNSAGVFNKNAVKTGKVTTTRPDDRTIQYTFWKSALGKPAKYRWRVVSNGDCASGACEAAPDFGKPAVVHHL